jgi:hypothetical protein
LASWSCRPIESTICRDLNQGVLQGIADEVVIVCFEQYRSAKIKELSPK